MRSLFLFLASNSDLLFQNWCDSVGIESPKARLMTTSKSIAGRGVFATDDMEEGFTAIKIPGQIVLHEYNAAAAFPNVARTIEKAKKRFERRKKWWRRILPVPGKQFEFTDTNDLWQAELTEYSLASLDLDNIWAPWILQWQRSDPIQYLLQKNTSPYDEDRISVCVKELHRLLPHVEEHKIKAAVDIRIRRYHELRDIFMLDDSFGKMYGFLISRALELGDGTVGVIPMFDMINHSNDPNLVLSFNGAEGAFELMAKRKIKCGEELLVCYQDQDINTDEYSDLWAAIQWGIPVDMELSERNFE